MAVIYSQRFIRPASEKIARIRLRRGPACIVLYYLTHESQAQISTKSCMVPLVNYLLPHGASVVSSESKGVRVEDDRANSAKANNQFAYVTFKQGADQPSIIGSKEPMGGHRFIACIIPTAWKVCSSHSILKQVWRCSKHWNSFRLSSRAGHLT